MSDRLDIPEATFQRAGGSKRRHATCVETSCLFLLRHRGPDVKTCLRRTQALTRNVRLVETNQ